MAHFYSSVSLLRMNGLPHRRGPSLVSEVVPHIFCRTVSLYGSFTGMRKASPCHPVLLYHALESYLSQLTALVISEDYVAHESLEQVG